MRQEDINMRFTENISELKTEQTQIKETVDSHSAMIGGMKEQLTTVVAEIKQIRNALYVMATTLAANLPMAQDAVRGIKHLLGL